METSKRNVVNCGTVDGTPSRKREIRHLPYNSPPSSDLFELGWPFLPWPLPSSRTHTHTIIIACSLPHSSHISLLARSLLKKERLSVSLPIPFILLFSLIN